MSRGVLAKDNLNKDTLLKLAEVGIFLVAATSPYFLHSIVDKYFQGKIKKIKRERAKRLRELQRRKLIDFKELSNGMIRITLTHLGKKLIRQYKLEEIKLEKPKKWDKKWRLVIYDIPIKQKKAGDAFRLKLKNLGLYQIQKSVWVSPYECMSEIEFTCGVFDIDINKYVFYIKTDDIPKKKEVEEFFNLR